MSTTTQEWNQQEVKARANAYLEDAIRWIDTASELMEGEQGGPALRAQAEEVKLVKARLQAIMAMPVEASKT